MSRAANLKISSASAAKVSPCAVAENLFSNYIPQKILLLDALLRVSRFTVFTDGQVKMDDTRAPRSSPRSPPGGWLHGCNLCPSAPKCGFIKGNEKIMLLLDRVKPEIVAFREVVIAVSCWIQHLIPKIEDGNDFGVAVQEKILERIGAVKTKVDSFQTNINKYFSERGDAVAKASKETHVMDYRSLVHEKDEAVFSEIRVIVLDIRGFYAEFYDIISKNLDKVTNPKGEEKPSMY
uniref:Proteasome activator complex subunit 2 n=1 Tax=Mola mola TaxID=94237 RepID=A0A3Q4ALC2_MOLML